MTEQSKDRLRSLFTEVGCIMEDASVMALIWDDADPKSAQDRYRQLSRAHYQIGTTLEKIKAAINGG